MFQPPVNHALLSGTGGLPASAPGARSLPAGSCGTGNLPASVFTARAAGPVRLAASVLLALALAVTSGCRKAAVERHNERVTPAISAGEPAYMVRPANPSPNQPWYRELQVVLDAKPENDAELEQAIAAQKKTIQKNCTVLLEEVRGAVETRRKPRDKWSVLGMTCGRQRKGSDVTFTADIGLTKLFARRPVISFNNVPLDMSVSKLARETGILESQPRGYNPRIYWQKTNVSAYEALEEILATHGFDRKFADTHAKLSLRIQDYQTRAAFVEAAAQAVVERGDLLQKARAALVVTPREKPAGEALPEPAGGDGEFVPAPANPEDEKK